MVVEEHRNGKVGYKNRANIELWEIKKTENSLGLCLLQGVTGRISARKMFIVVHGKCTDLPCSQFVNGE